MFSLLNASSLEICRREYKRLKSSVLQILTCLYYESEKRFQNKLIMGKYIPIFRFQYNREIILYKLILIRYKPKLSNGEHYYE